MDGRNRIKVAVAALAGGGLALLSACGGAVVQREDYDVVKQELSAKVQELTAVQQQLTALQQQAQPAAPREPKRLEAKLRIDMGETPNEMFFATQEGVKGGPFRVAAGKTVGIHFVNKGEEKHEFMFGRTPMIMEGQVHGYDVNVFDELDADLFVYAAGKMVEIGGSKFEEIELEPGAEVWMRTAFPAELKGEWEIGCFVQEPNKKGHYEQGMKAKLIIE